MLILAAILAAIAMIAMWLLPSPKEEALAPHPAKFSRAVEAAIPTTTAAPTTTTTTPPPPPPTTAKPRPVRPTTTTQRASRSAGAGGSDRTWTALAACESGGNPNSVSDSNPTYYGAFQFSLATWHSVGGTGNPTDHSYEVQLAMAKKLQARSGWSQWPKCAKRLGLI